MEAEQIQQLFNKIKNRKIEPGSTSEFNKLKQDANKLFDILDTRIDEKDIKQTTIRIVKQFKDDITAHIRTITEGGLGGSPKSLEYAERIFNQSILPLFSKTK